MKHCICSIPFAKCLVFFFEQFVQQWFWQLGTSWGKKITRCLYVLYDMWTTALNSYLLVLCTFDRFDIYLANIHPLFLYIAFPITVKIYSAIYSSLNHLKLKMLFINGDVHWDRYKDLEPDRSKKRKSDNLQSIPLRQWSCHNTPTSSSSDQGR